MRMIRLPISSAAIMDREIPSQIRRRLILLDFSFCPSGAGWLESVMDASFMDICLAIITNIDRAVLPGKPGAGWRG